MVAEQGKPGKPGRKTGTLSRQERSARALRENLRKRKDQAEARRSGDSRGSVAKDHGPDDRGAG